MNRAVVSQPVKAAFLFVFLSSYLGIFSISKIRNPHRVVMIRIFQYRSAKVSAALQLLHITGVRRDLTGTLHGPLRDFAGTAVGP